METIAGSARSALVDAQRVIEGAEDDGLRTPQPQLEDITGLIDGMRSSLDIDEGTSGEPRELSSGQQLAVFRIVQECLTNVLKHGGRGTAVRLHFDWNGPGLTLLAVSDLTEHPRTPEGTQEQRPGRGIPGMQERAHLAGGWLTALPDGEQFRVTLFLPYGAADNRPGAGIVPEGAKSVAGSGETTGPALSGAGQEETRNA